MGSGRGATFQGEEISQIDFSHQRGALSLRTPTTPENAPYTAVRCAPNSEKNQALLPLGKRSKQCSIRAGAGVQPCSLRNLRSLSFLKALSTITTTPIPKFGPDFPHPPVLHLTDPIAPPPPSPSLGSRSSYKSSFARVLGRSRAS